jgi:thiosulfate/3-mercaptopyruvate sulfurtransferase
MVATFSRLGVGQDMQVVAYDADNGMYASRLWWMLRYLGYDPVAVLDGGFDRWTRETLPVRSGDETGSAAAPLRPQVRHDWRVTIDDMAAGTASQALLIDARAPERFEGRSEPLDKAAGHIPGAVNRFYKDNLGADGLMRPAAELRQEFDAVVRARPAADVVMYCGSGVTACQNLLAFEYAGIAGARLFVGSWSEWSADPARPIETGPSRRQL